MKKGKAVHATSGPEMRHVAHEEGATGIRNRAKPFVVPVNQKSKKGGGGRGEKRATAKIPTQRPKWPRASQSVAGRVGRRCSGTDTRTGRVGRHYSVTDTRTGRVGRRCSRR